MSGGAYPCNVDCGKRQQLEKHIAELEERVDFYAEGVCKRQAELIERQAELIEELRGKLRHLRATIDAIANKIGYVPQKTLVPPKEKPA
jgi:uncharacterized coiled-coil protein SlyX